jgi:hypothetical protein
MTSRSQNQTVFADIDKLNLTLVVLAYHSSKIYRMEPIPEGEKTDHRFKMPSSNLNEYGADTDQGETEDEEVKMNCIGGKCGMHDSDLSSDSDAESADEVDPNEKER